MKEKEKEKDSRGAKRIVFPVFKINGDKLVYQGTCLSKNHAANVIDSYSANIGMYIDMKINKLGDYVVVQLDIEDEYIDSKSAMVKAYEMAKKRFNRSKLNITIDKIKDLSDDQVEQITSIINK